MRPIPTIRTLLYLLLILAAVLPGAAAAQRLDRPLRVFLDCNGFFCDLDFFVQEIPWATFVRDRQDADIHALGTRQETGAGGSAYAFELRGLRVFEGERVTLSTTTIPDATEAARRSALVEAVTVGLLPFARSTSSFPVVEVTAAAGDEAAGVAEVDPWNRWTFRVGVNGFVNGESQQRSLSGSGSASANRVTEQWKTLFSIRGSTNRSEFELDDSTTFTSRRESYGANALLARSIGGQWSAGGILEWNRSSFANYDASVVIGPALEYNVFPYTESSRRLLTVLYAIGPRYNDYAETTLFGATSETLLEQLLVVSYDVTQPWGNIDISARGDHYITAVGDGEDWQDPQFSAQVGGGFDVRLLRGLSARLHGSVAMIRNQIQLPAEGLTEEEILTQQRELATSYRYFGSFGLSYRFGSIFSDVVNPRFESFD